MSIKHEQELVTREQSVPSETVAGRVNVAMRTTIRAATRLLPAVVATVAAVTMGYALRAWHGTHLVWYSVSVFATAEVAGDLSRLVISGQQVIVEDMVREAAFFGLLGVVAAIAIGLVEAHLGGPVTPVLPALVVYYVTLAGRRA